MHILKIFFKCLTFLLLLVPKSTAAQVANSTSQSSHSQEAAAAMIKMLNAVPPPRYQESIIYLDQSGTDWVLAPTFSSGATLVRWHAGSVQTILPPVGTTPFSTCYGRGALWCTAGNDALQRIELFRFDLDLPSDGWIKIGYFDGIWGAPIMALPLRGTNKYLGISTTGLCESNGKNASFVGIFKNDSGVIRLDSCAKMPFDGHSNVINAKFINYNNPPQTTTLQTNQIGKKGYWCAYASPSILTPTLIMPSISNNYIVIGAASAGVLWIYDTNDGQLRKTINITGFNENDLTKLSPLTYLILGTSFTPDGDLIVAALDPDLIKLTKKIDVNNLKAIDKNLRNQDFDFFRKDFKNIFWWRINLKTGIRRHVDDPVAFSDKLPRLSSFTTFRFLVNTMGEIRSNAFQPWKTVLKKFINKFPQSDPKQNEPLKK